jgi:hypothetical protein
MPQAGYEMLSNLSRKEISLPKHSKQLNEGLLDKTTWGSKCKVNPLINKFEEAK